MATGIRRVLACALAAFALLLAVWSCNPVEPLSGIPRPRPSIYPPGSYAVDFPQAWTPAGDSLYMLRNVPST